MRSCTCHPDDNPPAPCPQKYALSECRESEVMRLWRECGLPEYFLGNGGTNHKLVAFARRCSETAMGKAEAEARRYAGHYPRMSDGWNTFLMLADRIAELAEGR